MRLRVQTRVNESKLKLTMWEQSQMTGRTNSNFKTGYLHGPYTSSLKCSEWLSCLKCTLQQTVPQIVQAQPSQKEIEVDECRGGYKSTGKRHFRSN